MDLTDVIFLLFFLPVSLILYYLGRKEIRKYVLLAVSLFFYACGAPDYFLLLISAMVVNLVIGWLISKNPDDKKISLGLLIIGIGFNLANLVYYKYFDFISSNIAGILRRDFAARNLVLPLGLSFFTFKAISYLVDIYKGKITVDHSPVEGALYLSFFAQMQSGPLSRYNDMYGTRTTNGRSFTLEDFSGGGIPIYHRI